MKIKKITSIAIAGVLALSLGGCGSDVIEANTETSTLDTEGVSQVSESTSEVQSTETESTETQSTETQSTETQSVEGSMLVVEDMFTDRDLDQSPDLSEATALTMENDSEITITEEGIYILSGQATDSMIRVEADDEAKIQLVLDEVSVINENQPVIYVKSADKVYVTTTATDNYLEVSDDYIADGESNLDAVIYSKDDLVLNGTGTLEIVSTDGNGITSKDDLKVTGGTLMVYAALDGLEANDSVRIYDGDMTIQSGKDAIHSENDEDDSLGYIYIQGGEMNIAAADDGIRGTSVVQIDGGTIHIETSSEGIEGTYLQINGGSIDIYATDDGINATGKSSSYDVVIEVNGGDIQVSMASGDTDAFDSNGVIYLNGGTIDLTCGSSFDANNGTQLGDADVTVNGEVITEISASQQGGRGTKKR